MTKTMALRQAAENLKRKRYRRRASGIEAIEKYFNDKRTGTTTPAFHAVWLDILREMHPGGVI